MKKVEESQQRKEVNLMPLAVVCRDASGSLSQKEAVRFLRKLHDKHYTKEPEGDANDFYRATEYDERRIRVMRR
jgi:hypothetical protein